MQSERSLDRSEGGLGIGLSVVQRLIDMHGGQVRPRVLDPDRAQPLRFPCRQSPLPSGVEPEPSRLEVEPRRVLVVDDNIDAATSLAELLRLEGHQTQAVYSAKEALEAVANFSPDVVLLDIGLPDMDGYEVAKRIRAGGSRSSRCSYRLWPGRGCPAHAFRGIRYALGQTGRFDCAGTNVAGTPRLGFQVSE